MKDIKNKNYNLISKKNIEKDLNDLIKKKKVKVKKVHLYG